MLPLFESAEDFLRQQDISFALDADLFNQVAQIIQQVREEGDGALTYFTQKFDGIVLENLRVPVEAIRSARDDLAEGIKDLLLSAIESVRHFHLQQRPKSWIEEAADGTRLGMQFTPINQVGIYIPGGTAAYPSTAIMTVVPAQIAGVERLVLVSPPKKDGSINPYVLAVAGLLGVTEIYTIGGAQAIAALAYGTESVPKVDKIFGPGNAYVNEAKRQVFGAVGVDGLAGPTEVVILADEYASPEYVVRDLLAQAEHDTEARGILLTTSRELAKRVQAKAALIIKKTERAGILQTALEKFGAVVLISNLKEGVQLINELAPEHVQIVTQNPEKLLPDIRNAGAICLGAFTPAVVGDYCAGPNHVLPTRKNAKFSSPLNVLDFMKFSSIINYSRERFDRDARKIAKFAELEGLINHKNAITCRYE